MNKIVIPIIICVWFLLIMWAFQKGLEASTVPQWQGIVIHITDTRLDYDLKMCNTGHRDNGWDSCGYNYLIKRDGTLQISRGAYKTGAHVKGHNSKYLGIGFVGKTDVTEKQVQVYRSLKSNLEELFWELKVYPHSDFNKGKICPTVKVWKVING